MSDLKPENGRILISEPFMMDPSFKRTVVLLCDHQDEGSFGLILNRPLNMNLNEVLPELELHDFPLYYGGPVGKDTLHFIHAKEDMFEDALPISSGLAYGGDFERLKQLLEDKEFNNESIRFFVGYSGWSAGQLDLELKEKSWIVSKTEKEDVFDSKSSEMWESSLVNMGGSYQLMAKFPEDPSLN